MTQWDVQKMALGDRAVTLHVAGPLMGPRVLVLHDAGADTVDAPAWGDLTSDHCVVQVLLPGYGGSTPPPPGSDIRWIVHHLIAVIDALGWETAHVVGTSLGGWFATELGLAASDRVSLLTLCAPAGLQHPQAYLLALFADGRAAAGTERLIEQTLRAHLPSEWRTVDSMPTALAVATMAPYVADLAAAALSSWNPWAPDPGMRRRLEELRVPTTILWGEKDALIPLIHGRVMADAVPDARLEIVPGAGHLLPLDHPDLVAARIRGA